jgi:uncharacterized protein YjfI (DUF2170 family)
MSLKTSAHYQREFRRRLREQGLIKKEVWIRPEHSKLLLRLEKQLRETAGRGNIEEGETMLSESLRWNTESLYQAIGLSELVKDGNASIELIEGLEPVVHIQMNGYGDLPLFLTVSGEQIVVECLLWPVSSVKNTAEFNEAVLKTHKYFPLSTISLEPTVEGEDCYFMFGALSCHSVLNSVQVEIETLARNALQATEAYSEYLVSVDEDQEDA